MIIETNVFKCIYSVYQAQKSSNSQALVQTARSGSNPINEVLVAAIRFFHSANFKLSFCVDKYPQAI